LPKGDFWTDTDADCKVLPFVPDIVVMPSCCRCKFFLMERALEVVDQRLELIGTGALVSQTLRLGLPGLGDLSHGGREQEGTNIIVELVVVA
jgi:hypothetical protein